MPGSFSQWNKVRYKRKREAKVCLFLSPCFSGHPNNSCFCSIAPTSSGQIHCGSSFVWVALTPGLTVHFFPLSLQSWQWWWHAAVARPGLASPPPACSFSSNTVITRASPLISQIAVTNTRPTSHQMLPPPVSLLNQKEFAILGKGKGEKETRTDMDK